MSYQSDVEKFLASGGKVTNCDDPLKAALLRMAGSNAKDPDLIGCTCGCHGDYTDHTMRLGERGL